MTEERFAALEREQDKMRARLDAYEYLLRSAPDRAWLAQSLEVFIAQQQGDALKYAYPEDVADRRQREFDALLMRLRA